MREHHLSKEANRRDVLRLSGLGVLGGVAGNALLSGRVKADDQDIAMAAIAIPYASWIHGHSMHIEYPDRIVSERRTGFSINLDCKPGLTNWFHFAIPTPVIVNDVRLKVGAVMLRFKTYSVDAWVQSVHVYDGEALIDANNGLKLSKDHLFEKFTVTDKPLIQWGLGISIGVACGVEMMDHHIEFFAAGSDFAY